MKKTMMAVVTAAVVGACSSEPKYLSYEGLSMGLPAKVFADSLLKRGMVVDTLNEETDRVVMLMPGETKKVSFRFAREDFSLINRQEQRVTEPGEFVLRIGHSSRDEDLLEAAFRL